MNKTISIVSTIISLAVFFGLFFGVNYSEVKRSKYIPTICYDLSSTIISKYCCKLRCTCTNAPLGIQKCNSLVLQSQFLSPDACNQNGTICPKKGREARCDDGYYCCSNSNCKGSCCDSVNHRSCYMTCHQCYNVELYVTYNVGQHQQNSTYRQDFSRSFDNARVFLTAHMPSSTFWCYYNPSSVNEIILNRDFTPWKWTLLALPSFALLVCFMALTNWALQAYIEDKTWRWSAVSLTWISIIVPLVILLPVWKHGHFFEKNMMVIMIFILLLAAFGSLPIVIKLLIIYGCSRFQAISLSFMGLIIPLDIYVAMILYMSPLRKIIFIIFGIQLALVLLTIVCIVCISYPKACLDCSYCVYLSSDLCCLCGLCGSCDSCDSC